MLSIHGRWKIKVSDNILMQWFADSWNEEAVIAYIEEFRAAALPLIGQKWAIISVFEQWELGVPEIEPHVIAHCDWFKRNGCIKDCHVYSASKFKELQLENMIPHSEYGYERCVFPQLDEAISWLGKNGFVLSDAEFLYQLEGQSLRENIC